MTTFELPRVGPDVSLPIPEVARARSAAGAQALVLRHSGVPLVSMRCTVPVQASSSARDSGVRRLAASSLLAGTTKRSAAQLAEDLQRIGAVLEIGSDPEGLHMAGRAPVPEMERFLALVAEVLTEPAFRPKEVATERERLVQGLTIALAEPDSIAHHGLLRRLYGRHPYADVLPDPPGVRRLGPGALRRFHEEALWPAAATMVIAGDVDPGTASATAARAMEAWAGTPVQPPGTPSVSTPSRVLLIDRPGALQTNIRLGGPALRRGEPGHPALALATTILGGHFTSRLTENLRERHGYTYSPGAGLAEHPESAHLLVLADVATEVTGAALTEINYELSRIATSAVTSEEIEVARRYLTGSLALATQTQGGLASYVARLERVGLGVEFLATYPGALAEQDEGTIATAATRWLAPSRLTTVLVGDASKIAPVVEALAEVEVVGAPSAA